MEHKEAVETKEYTYTAVFQPAEEGGYVVTFPALRGCITQGDTLEDARAMAADALTRYLEGLRKLDRPIPTGEQTLGEPLTEPVRVILRTA